MTIEYETVHVGPLDKVTAVLLAHDLRDRGVRAEAIHVRDHGWAVVKERSDQHV
jgi:hypothetical protein